MKVVSGALIASDAAINVECGFEPDYVEMYTAVGGTELKYTFFKPLVDTSAGTGQFGILDTAGAKSVPTTAATGIVTYDAAANKVALPSPTGQGEAFADHPAAFVAGTSQPTARTATALGTLTKPSTGNENGLIAECTTDNGVYGTEPTWPTQPGQTVTDDQSNVWTMRENKAVVIGVAGFTIGVTVATDSEIIVFKAEQHDRSEDMGDADVKSPVTFA